MQPTPTSDLQMGEFGLPRLIGPQRLLMKVASRSNRYEGQAGDQVAGLQQPAIMASDTK